MVNFLFLFFFCTCTGVFQYLLRAFPNKPFQVRFARRADYMQIMRCRSRLKITEKAQNLSTNERKQQ